MPKYNSVYKGSEIDEAIAKIRETSTPEDIAAAIEKIANQTQESIDNAIANVRPYKVYTALLTQTGTDAPVATVLENTIGNIVWTREDAGYYVGTLASAFTANKTVVTLGSLFYEPNSGANTQVGYTNIASTSVIIILTIDTSSFSASDNIDCGLVNTMFEIRVYL